MQLMQMPGRGRDHTGRNDLPRLIRPHVALSHSDTLLIPVVGIVREPYYWSIITSPPSLKKDPCSQIGWTNCTTTQSGAVQDDLEGSHDTKRAHGIPVCTMLASNDRGCS